MKKYNIFKIGVLSLAFLSVDIASSFAQSALPSFDPKKYYCVHLQDGSKVCGSGKKFTPQADGTLLCQLRGKHYPANSIATIETRKNIMVPALLIGAAAGVGSGVALIATVGKQRGSSGDPTGTSIFANIAGVGLILLGPVVGGLVGYSLQESSAETIYPMVLRTSSGVVPGVGISGHY